MLQRFKDKKHSEMPAPPPKKKRKKAEVPKSSNTPTITNYFFKSKSKATRAKSEDEEQKLPTCVEGVAVGPTVMDICEELDNKPSSQLSVLSLCESQDGDASQSEISDWLQKSPGIVSRDGIASAIKPDFRNESSVHHTSRLMRTFSLDSSSQNYLTPSDQPVRNRSPLELEQRLLEARRQVLNLSPTQGEQPPTCHVNRFIEISKQATSREIQLHGSGKYFHEYKAEGRVGQGSFGEVCKCRHRFDGCVYAVKRVKKTSHNQSSESLKREARVMAALAQNPSSSPHLIRYIQSWEEQADVFIAMEFCENGTLASRRGQPMTNATLLQIFEQIGDALRAMHQYNFVHLDVKPSNILITDTFQFKLTDFGLATKVDVEDEISDGDRRYMSQELMDGSYEKHQLDKTDIFSLGASVYEMHLGTELPDGGLEWTLLRNPEFSFGPDIEPFVKELIQRSMNSDCDCRPTAFEIVTVVRERQSDVSQRVREQQKIIAEKDQEIEGLRGLLARSGQHL